MIHITVSKAALLVAVGGTGLALLTGCSSDPAKSTAPAPAGAAGSASSTPANAATSGAPSAARPVGQCTDASILAALPAGSTVVKYECAIASPTMWAVAQVNPGPTVYFLQSTSGAWKVSKADKACAGPSAKLPKEITAFCLKA